ncbi:ATP:cob(I)alamin adenosyltransferase [Marinococcus halophilus]|uniref:Corrinoid adenosyltransferase n=1 Tax=Marinococcus halophilus TaxID=1371 RepID=A0A510Y431_MARHA|nr:cob(I)yrinic acid a,c-diamide adenosyltransferase [Marinococcus halophilus]OZT80877.1 ATP:cob(I)alamin adenosyltransferase [Marinococcus halophilus]GEK57933.1 Cob(I)yrinic acid a,c-diamide adenosyltransferase [Marinococcus halophilus]
MKLYTRQGDRGDTSVVGGKRNKGDARIEAFGSFEEVNALIGKAALLAAEEKSGRDLQTDLERIQHELFDCGSDVADIRAEAVRKVDNSTVVWLENRIDEYTEEAPPLQKFILPGGTSLSAELHLARTVCRRAERELVRAGENEDVPVPVLMYVNRLSDYLFSAARIANSRAGKTDVEYERSAKVFTTEKERENKQ